MRAVAVWSLESLSRWVIYISLCLFGKLLEHVKYDVMPHALGSRDAQLCPAREI